MIARCQILFGHSIIIILVLHRTSQHPIAIFLLVGHHPLVIVNSQLIQTVLLDWLRCRPCIEIVVALCATFLSEVAVCDDALVGAFLGDGGMAAARLAALFYYLHLFLLYFNKIVIKVI